MGNVVLSREIAASPSQIWEVLGDFPNVADWSAGVKKSYATNDQSQGVGAKRHCDLAPAGEVEETVEGWTPNEQLVVSIDSSKKSPIKHALATFDLSPGDEGRDHGRCRSRLRSEVGTRREDDDRHRRETAH